LDADEINEEIPALLKGQAIDSNLCSVYAVQRNPRHLHVFLKARSRCEFETCPLLQLEMWLPEKYPSEPPKYRYLTEVDRANVDKDNHPDLDNVLGKWREEYNLPLLLMAVHAHQNLNKVSPGDKDWTSKKFRVKKDTGKNDELAMSKEDLKCFAPEYKYAYR